MDWDELDVKKKPSMSEEKEEIELGEREAEKVQSLVSQLQQIADKSGCGINELVEKYSGGEIAEDETEDEGSGNEDKVNLIVARMKAKKDV